VIFDDRNLSKVSFAGSDITRIRFGNKTEWGGKDKFTIIEDEGMRDKIKGKKRTWNENVSLELVSSVYRNLRENYEFRLRYDDAGKFFIREMELKRKYREDSSSLRENCWLRRNLFSLTGLYHLLSNYGESLWRPTIIGGVILSLSTLFFGMQSNGQWQEAFERSLADVIPLLPLGGDIRVETIDYIIKLLSTTLTFGLLAIALRRRFERKYTR